MFFVLNPTSRKNHDIRRCLPEGSACVPRYRNLSSRIRSVKRKVRSLENLLALSKSSVSLPFLVKSLSNIQRRVPTVKPINDFQVGEPIALLQNYLESLSTIQSYSAVYPSMNVQTLVGKLFDLFSILIEKCYCAKQQLNRRTMAMKMDPKADAEVLAMLELLKDEFGDCCTKSKLAFYRVRALKNVYENVKK